MEGAITGDPPTEVFDEVGLNPKTHLIATEAM
jgi:hypothetical protein